MNTKNTPVNIFIDCHNRELAMVESLIAHLSALKYSYNIKLWHPKSTRLGNKYQEERAKTLASADIVLLFMSADYLNSGDYQEYEKVFVQFSEQGKVLIPIRAKKSMWMYSDIGRLGLAALPYDGGVICNARNKPAVYTDIVERLIPVIDDVISQKRIYAKNTPHYDNPKPSSSYNRKQLPKGHLGVNDDFDYIEYTDL